MMRNIFIERLSIILLINIILIVKLIKKIVKLIKKTVKLIQKFEDWLRSKKN